MAYNPKSLKNLKPIKPGGIGNPGGSPVGKRISTWMVELGQSPEPLTQAQIDKLPYNGKVAWARLKRAAKIDAGSEGERSAEILLDRTEGGVDKKTTLTNLDVRHEQWRMLVNLANSMGYFQFKDGKEASEKMAAHRFLAVSKLIDELGRMIGGWIVFERLQGQQREVS